MLARILSSQLPDHVGNSVLLQGWVHRIRDLGAVRFLVLRDRGGFAQAIVPTSLDLRDLGSECVVAIDGVVRAEPRAPAGHEVVAENIQLISRADPPPFELYKPIVAAEQARLETMLDHRAISLRMPEVLDVFRIQAEIVRAFRAHLNAEGFTEIFTPKFVLAGAEGGAALFEIDYFGGKAFLAQSPQFYKQMMVGSGLERVFEVGHAYRAEKSQTTRHLTEFVSLDLEMGFIESEQDVMRTLGETIAAIFESLRRGCARELTRRKITLPALEDEVPQITFHEAKEILASEFNKTAGLDGDVDTEGERLIGQWARREHNSPLIFVTGYATDRRPAYAMPLASDPAHTASFDLLYDGVEICTGGQRLHDHAALVESFRRRGIRPESLEGYLEAFQHGMPPHGGMGLGLERFTQQLLGLDNVKQASLFPRDRNRLIP
jgi:nondiscriminating aspartyl-tRNA synthetase